jgi:hypothetical protein
MAPLAGVVAGIAVLPFFARASWQVAGAGFGLPLDDAWIHIRFAMNLAGGEGFSFNPGEPYAGSTSPLWVLILAGLRLLPGEAPTHSALASALAFVAACALAGLLGERLTRRALCEAPTPAPVSEDAGHGMAGSSPVAAGALAPRFATGALPVVAGAGAGLLTAITGRFAWSGLSGMEIALFAALTLLATWLFVGRDRTHWSLGWALVATAALHARPEGALFAALALGLAALQRHRIAGWPRAWPWTATALVFVPALPWVLFCLFTTGEPLPATFHPNRGGLGWPDMGFLLATVQQLVRDNPLGVGLGLAGMAILGAVAIGRTGDARLLLPAAWVLAFPPVASVVAPNLRHHGRYNMPLIPMMAVLAAVGAAALAVELHRLASVRRPPSRADDGTPTAKPCPSEAGTGAAARAGPGPGAEVAGRSHPSSPARASGWPVLGLTGFLLLVATIPAVAGLPRWVDGFGWAVENIRFQHERVARWLAGNAGDGCHVATNDIGAIGALSGCRVTDLIGLVTPEIARLYRIVPDPARRDPLIRSHLISGGVTHLAIYPGWFPSLARDPALTPVFEARLHGRTVTGAHRLRVYRTPGQGPW